MKKTFVFLCFLLIGISQVLYAGKPKAKHVVLIALDGWGAYSVPKAKDVPHISQLMADGCYTLKKRSVLPSSSAINWASMFNGAATEIHGYTQWGSKTPEIPSRVLNKHGVFPTIFSILQEQKPELKTACLYEWDGIKYLIDSLAVSHHALAPDYANHPTLLCEMAEQYIKTERPHFIAVCFDQLDHTGHDAGHDTPSYYDKLKELDSYAGRIMQAVKDAGMWEDTIIMMTSDHGGIKTGHGGITLEEMETPFIIAGKNVKRGGEFEESMMQYDTASTIAYIFGVKQPQVWVGRPMTQVFK